MDSQLSSHGSSYAYSSPHYPEFYDLWVAELFGSGSDSDAATFSSVFLPLLRAPPPIDVTVVDVGTGTGRVLKNLYKVLTANPIDTDASVNFYGFDNGPSMLDRAERTFNMDVAAALPVSDNVKITSHWKVASASRFIDELGLGDKSVDVVLFAAGAIGHLTDAEEVQAFLDQIAKGLKPTGRAVVSVLNDMVVGSGFHKTEGAIEKKDQVKFEKPMRIKSLETAGLVYIKSPTERRIDGDLMTEYFSVKGVKIAESEVVNEEDVLWTQELSWSLRFFDEIRWKSVLEKVGLEVEKVEETEFQKWYILKVKPLLGG